MTAARLQVVFMLSVLSVKMSPGKAPGGEGVGTAMGTPTLPLPLFSRLLLQLLGWLPPLLPLLNTRYRLHTPHIHVSCYTLTDIQRRSISALKHTNSDTYIDEPTAHTWQENTQQQGLVQCLWHMAAFASHRKNGEATAKTHTECTNAEHMEHRLHEIMCLRCREKSKKKSTNQSVIRWRSLRHFFEMERKRQQCQANIELKQLTRPTLNGWREEWTISIFRISSNNYFLSLHEIDLHLFFNASYWSDFKQL